jgi:hypothetical protein
MVMRKSKSNLPPGGKKLPTYRVASTGSWWHGWTGLARVYRRREGRRCQNTKASYCLIVD